VVIQWSFNGHSIALASEALAKEGLSVVFQTMTMNDGTKCQMTREELMTAQHAISS
jgi:hypothetical protein